MDASIKEGTVNDFAAFFAAHPHLHAVFFNGSAAKHYFLKGAAISDYPCMRFFLLPSSSPARAMPFETEKRAWQEVKRQAELK